MTALVPLRQEVESTAVLSSAHEQAIELLSESLAVIDDLVRANPDDTQGLALTQLLLARMAKELGTVRDNCSEALWESMDSDQCFIDGIGHIQRRYGSSRRNWAHDDIWTAALTEARRRAIDPDSGEVLMSEGEALRQVVREWQTPGAWRVTELRRAGLDVDELAEVVWGKRSVQITGGAS